MVIAQKMPNHDNQSDNQQIHNHLARTSSTGTDFSMSSSASTTAPAWQQYNSSGKRINKKNPLRVLGIAMIVDERGSGARLVARYPTQPSSEERMMGRNGPATSNTAGGGLDDNIENPQNTASSGGISDDIIDNTNGGNDLFFTLTARQMAKLFRTKKSLCNQHMTLRVNRTIFCCYAVLLDTDDEGNDNDEDELHDSGTIGGISSAASTGSNSLIHTSTADSTSELTLFSIVVALSAPICEAAIPFSTFWDSSTDDQLDLERYLRHVGSHNNNNNNNDKNDTMKMRKAKAARVSSAFLAIRRVHMSLARLCRALEREEQRCKYVSIQAYEFFKIRNERQKRWEEIIALSNAPVLAPTSSGGGGGIGGGSATSKHHPPTGSSSASVMTSNTGEQQHRKGRHARTNSFGAAAVGPPSFVDEVFRKLNVAPSVEQEQEKEQEILELMLALPPPERPAGTPQHYGNLVRELVLVFHALSRRDYKYPPTASSLLCERDSVVYINQHLAIPIEAAGLDNRQTSTVADNGPIVRPYYTLLFPHASPSELLQTFHSSGSSAPQRMEQLLLTVNPQKILTEIAIDANLPLSTTMEIASFLVVHGACITSPVVSSQSRLTCVSVQRISELSLEFSQAFPGINLFGVVSFLTTSRTLGETMAVVTDIDEKDGSWLRDSLMASPCYKSRLRNKAEVAGINVPTTGSSANAKATGNFTTNTIGGVGQATTTSEDEFSPLQSHSTLRPIQPPPSQDEAVLLHKQWSKDLEELLYSIAIWLLSHGVITHLQEYLVVVAAASISETTNLNSEQESAATTQPTENKVSKVSNRFGNDPDELLFKELMELEYLNGDWSIMALSWRLGMDIQQLRAWGLRHTRVRVLSRVATTGDDLESSPTLLTTQSNTT